VTSVDSIIHNIKKQSKGKRIVFVSGNFNIVHAGHTRMLNFAKSVGDILVLGLSLDTDPSVIVPYQDRESALRSLEPVDFIVPCQAAELIPTIELLKPDILVKGREHESNDNPEVAVLQQWGGRLLFSGGDSVLSSRDLIRQELSNRTSVHLRRNTEFLVKHDSSRNKLTQLVQRFVEKKVCVIGDLIMDEYIHCDPLGMSQEDPTIVITPIENNMFVGGAGIVAAHLASLGAPTTLLTVTGSDLASINASIKLKDYCVNHEFLIDMNRPTTLKQRFRVGGKTMLRVTHLQSQEIEEKHQSELYEQFKKIVNELDLVVFSDFNYGCLPQKLVDKISLLCDSLQIPYVADSQSSSQSGDISRFQGAELLSATEREARIALNDYRSGLQHIGNTLISKSRAKSLILKLGAEGLIALTTTDKFATDNLPTLNQRPVDVAGAGDALLAAASLCGVSGGSIWESAYLGSIAAAVQVSRIGNTPLKCEELLSEIT
jgi:rfaE bifunctional protein kinase chain/domain